MRNLLLLLSLSCFTQCRTQPLPQLNFDKTLIACEDRWIAHQMDDDSIYSFGFVYIDEEAGPTIQYGGKFKIASNGRYKRVHDGMDSISLKARLEPSNVRVALIPDSKLTELQIKAIPDWLKYYKATKDTIGRLVKWGFLYNAWDECVLALTFLEKAYQVKPHYDGLEFELSYAYNVLQRYDKAILVLEKAAANNPRECLFYKELAYAASHSEQLQKAKETYETSTAKCADNVIKAEIAYNIAYSYFVKKDKEHFIYWAAETKKWSIEGSNFLNNIHNFETELSKYPAAEPDLQSGAK